MTGRVNADYEAVVEVAVRTDGTAARVQAVVDTGFSEFLVLPRAALMDLGAAVEREEPLILGDGSITLMDVYVVDVEWFGAWREVKTYASDGDALIGMKLLEGHELQMRVVPDGEVRLTPL